MTMAFHSLSLFLPRCFTECLPLYNFLLFFFSFFSFPYSFIMVTSVMAFIIGFNWRNTPYRAFIFCIFFYFPFLSFLSSPFFWFTLLDSFEYLCCLAVVVYFVNCTYVHSAYLIFYTNWRSLVFQIVNSRRTHLYHLWTACNWLGVEKHPWQ